MHLLQVLLFALLHVRAESDDLASFSDSFYEDVSSDSVINVNESKKEDDRKIEVQKSIKDIKLKPLFNTSSCHS